MRPRGSAEELERRRWRAMELLKQGEAPVEVARQLQVDRRSVRRWKAAHSREGGAGLRSRPTPGRPPKLAEAEKEQLQEILLKGAKAAGFPSELWTCPRVARVIARHFGVRYHVDHIGRLLHGLGWTPQKPQRRAVERDEGAIRNWIRRDWPRIKKKPGD